MIAVAIIALIVLIWGIANRKNLPICNIVESCFEASVISLMMSMVIGLTVSNFGLHDVSTKQYTVSNYAVKNGYLSYALQKDELDELDVIKTSSFDIEKSNSNNNYVKKIKQQSKYSYLKWIFIFSDFKTTKTVLCIKTE